MPNGFHTHNYNGMTSITDRHDHGYFGKTDREADTMGHSHIMEGYTTRADGHTHLYRIRTGPAVHRKDGHYHCYEGNTDAAEGHIHRIQGCTSID